MDNETAQALSPMVIASNITFFKIWDITKSYGLVTGAIIFYSLYPYLTS